MEQVGTYDTKKNLTVNEEKEVFFNTFLECYKKKDEMMSQTIACYFFEYTKNANNELVSFNNNNAIAIRIRSLQTIASHLARKYTRPKMA